ncbi:MAG: hypothetical protein ABSG71_17875 [Thermodesulfobacteriota bacterium]
MQQAVARLVSPLRGRQSVVLATGEGKVPQPVAKIGYREIVQQLAALMFWGCFLHLLKRSWSGYLAMSPG